MDFQESSLTPRVAVVTGASSGIGRAVVWSLLRSTANVVATGRRLDALEDLQRECSELPGNLLIHTADVTDEDFTSSLLAKATSEWGPVDLFVTAAGIGIAGTVLDSDDRQWRHIVEVNYLSVLRQLRAFGAHLLANTEVMAGRRVGDLVVIGSTVGRQVSSRNPVYGSTKFAVHSLTEALRQELSGHGIRVSLIEPGFVLTQFQERAGYDPQWFAGVQEQAGPLLSSSDVARVVTFMVSQPAHVHIDDLRIRPTRQAQ